MRKILLLILICTYTFSPDIQAQSGDEIMAEHIVNALYKYQMDDALALCDQCSLDNEDILALKSATYYLMANRDKNESYYQKAESLLDESGNDPSSAISHTAWALHYGIEANRSAFTKKAEYARKAVDQAKLAVEKDPGMAHGHYIIGRYYYGIAALNSLKLKMAQQILEPGDINNGNYSFAFPYLNKAAELVPYRFLYVYTAGNCLWEMGEHEKALEYFKRAESLELHTEEDREAKREMEKILAEEGY